eukprot:TRINITY_DN34062_c0_g1_i3.p1 TRINITY_DN34062_c0_g1~~TRINITY_DN34062_c0_g1_i3.p1  ORF type:complete len:164 (-),score=42.31 TRINITY_DN34062_c0_g1_i3:34-525(-)
MRAPGSKYVGGSFRSLAHDVETVERQLGEGRPVDGILKVDVEGSEWLVLSETPVLQVLPKFQQIVVEFHNAFMFGIMDAARFAVRNGAIENLLRHFVVVHVHLVNTCKVPLASCIEVTFLRKDLVEEVPCKIPEPHPLDYEGLPTDLDIFNAFGGLYTQLQHQ